MPEQEHLPINIDYSKEKPANPKSSARRALSRLGNIVEDISDAIRQGSENSGLSKIPGTPFWFTNLFDTEEDVRRRHEKFGIQDKENKK